MFTQDSTTTMVGLIKSLEASMKVGYVSALKDLASISVGFPSVESGYPSLQILPIKERIKRIYSSQNYYDVIRTIRFEVQSVKPSREASFGQSTGIVNNIRVLLTRKGADNFWKLKSLSTGEDIVLNTEVSGIKNPEPQGVEGGGVQSIASIDIDFYTQGRFDDSMVIPQDSQILTTTTNVKEISKILTEILESYKNSILNEVKQIKYGVLEPEGGNFVPFIGVYIGDSNIESSFASINSFNNTITFAAHTSIFDQQYSIYQNMDMIDKIRKIIFANKFVLQRCYDYKFGDVTYGARNLEEGLPVYVSQLDIETKSLERIY